MNDQQAVDRSEALFELNEEEIERIQDELDEQEHFENEERDRDDRERGWAKKAHELMHEEDK